MAEEKKITVSYRRSNEYKVMPATGAWGGPTPDGHLLANFFVEHASVPSYQTFPADESGKVDMRNARDSVASGDLERELMVGIVLSPTTALSVAKWLTEHAKRILDGGQE